MSEGELFVTKVYQVLQSLHQLQRYIKQNENLKCQTTSSKVDRVTHILETIFLFREVAICMANRPIHQISSLSISLYLRIIKIRKLKMSHPNSLDGHLSINSSLNVSSCSLTGSVANNNNNNNNNLYRVKSTK